MIPIVERCAPRPARVLLCGRRALSALPVSDRAYLSITGPDAKKLLQGLTTNDINKLETGSCQASAFLNTKVCEYYLLLT